MFFDWEREIVRLGCTHAMWQFTVVAYRMLLFAIPSILKNVSVCAPHSAFGGVYTAAASAAANADDNNKDTTDGLTVAMFEFCTEFAFSYYSFFSSFRLLVLPVLVSIT